MPHGYVFTPFKDSSGNDIHNKRGSLPDMMAHCDSLPECKGFNTNGWMKKALRPENQWNTWTADPDKGFYAKIEVGEDEDGTGESDRTEEPDDADSSGASAQETDDASLPGYEFVPFMDSGGNNIGNKRGTLEEMKAYCDGNSKCKGFSSNGWMKKKLKRRSRWTKWTDDPTKGFYVKESAA